MSAKNHRPSISLRDRDQVLSAIERELQIIEHVTGIASHEMQRSDHHPNARGNFHLSMEKLLSALERL